VLDGLAALVDHSLLRPAAGIDGASRFVMLETIRAYAVEQLAMSDAAAALHQCHAVYYLALVEHAEPLLHRAEQVQWLDRLEAEHDNLRAALTLSVWCLAGLGRVAVAQRQPERAAQLFGTTAALSEVFDPRMDPTDRADYECAVAVTRAQLDAATFAAAWAAGRAITLEQAITGALASIEMA
jgi:hypothetical protein